jgi:GNAT superfamily N-acetyltransferase
VAPIHVGQAWQQHDPRKLLLRPFDGSAQDLDALARIRNETLRPITLPEHFTEAAAHDMDRFYNRGDFNLLDNCWLMFLGDAPAAAAVLYPRVLFNDRPPGNFDMYVVPEYRRHGLGSRLLAHLEQAAPARGYPVLETTIAREDDESTGFLARQGFAVVGQSMHLSRYDLTNLPPVSPPPGYTIRSLTDLGEPTDLYRETTNRLGSYDPNYSLIRPEEMESTVQGDSWEPEGVLFMLDPAARIVGLIRASGARSGRGYLHEIRLEPSSRGKGLGRAMLAAALHYLSNAGVTTAELDTSSETGAAHSLALRAGFTVTRHWLHFLKRLMGSTA